MGSTLQRPLVGAGSMRSAVGTTVSVEGAAAGPTVRCPCRRRRHPEKDRERRRLRTDGTRQAEQVRERRREAGGHRGMACGEIIPPSAE